MSRKKVVKTVYLVGLMIITSFSAHAGVGTTGAEFLNTSLGARPGGMGNAFSAIADDVNTVCWNPAGLTVLKGKEASFTYTNLGTVFDVSGAGSMYDGFLGYAQPLKNGDALAVSLQYQEQRKLAYTTETPEVIAEYNLGANYAAIFSYAGKLSSSLSWGASFKFIQAKLWQRSGHAWAVDLGGLYQNPGKEFTVGLSIQNTGTKLKMEDVEGADSLPQNLKLGTEYWYRNLIALRLGYLNKEGDVRGLTQGIGLRYHGYEVDFANVPWGELGHVQRMSLTTRF